MYSQFMTHGQKNIKLKGVKKVVSNKQCKKERKSYAIK